MASLEKRPKNARYYPLYHNIWAVLPFQTQSVFYEHQCT